MNDLLDADATIDHLEGEQGVRALYPSLSSAGIALAETTLLELYTGVFRAPDPVRAERQLRSFLRTVTVLPLGHG